MGKFNDEIVPVEVVKKIATGQEVARETITQDETINPGLTVQKAALYPTVFKENGTVTPANSCPISDGAAAMIVCTAEKAQELGLKPTARIVAYAYAAVDPAYMGIGPAYAMPKALRKAGLTLDDIDLIELNEAFAAQCLAVGKEMQAQGHNWTWDKVNVNGGAIALGHPVGCTAELAFKELRVPHENVLGKVGEGFVTFMKTLDMGRLTLGAACLGGAQAALEWAVRWAKTRKQFGELAHKQSVQRRDVSELADEATLQPLIEKRGQDFPPERERGTRFAGTPAELAGILRQRAAP